MKFELKTENDTYFRSFSKFFGISVVLALIIILCDSALKLGVISRHYQIEYKCRLLAVKKSPIIFKKLSKISNLKSKQGIWEFCRDIVK